MPERNRLTCGGDREQREAEAPEELLRGATPEPRRGEPCREDQRDERGGEREQRTGDLRRLPVPVRADDGRCRSRPHHAQVVEVAAPEHPLVRGHERVPPRTELAAGHERERRPRPVRDDERNRAAPVEVVELVRVGVIHRRRADQERANIAGVHTQSVHRIRGLRIVPREQLDRPAARPQELARDVARQRRLVRVAHAARPDPGDGREEGQQDEEQGNRPDGPADAGAVGAGPTNATPRRPAVQKRTTAGMGAIQRSGGEQRARGQVGELDLPADAVQRTVDVRRERDRDHGPCGRRAHQQQDRRGEREPCEQPADAGEAHHRERELVAGERGRAPSPHATRDLPRVARGCGPELLTAGRALRRRQPPRRAGVRREPDQQADGSGNEDERLPRLEGCDRARERLAVRDPVRLHGREGNPTGVVQGDTAGDGR